MNVLAEDPEYDEDADGDYYASASDHSGAEDEGEDAGAMGGRGKRKKKSGSGASKRPKSGQRVVEDEDMRKEAEGELDNLKKEREDEKKEVKKSKVDDLWASMNAPAARPKKALTPSSGAAAGAAGPSGGGGGDNSGGGSGGGGGSKANEMVTVKRKYDYGGEILEVTEKVKAGSAAAKRAEVQASAESAGHAVKSTKDNVQALLSALGKKGSKGSGSGTAGASGGLRTDWTSGSAATFGMGGGAGGGGAGAGLSTADRLDAALKSGQASVRAGGPGKKGDLGSLLSSLAPKKMTSIDKSRMDWSSFKKDKLDDSEKDQLEKQAQSGYLDKQAFLNRADWRQHEFELSGRGKK